MTATTMEPVSSEEVARFKAAMRCVAGSVSVIALDAPNGERAGITVSSLVSLSAEPPSVLFTVNASASLHPLLAPGVLVGINVLASHQRAVAQRFGSRSVRGEARFAEGGWVRDAQAPRLAEAQVFLAVRVDAMHVYGSHSVVLAHVLSVRTAEAVAPLIYVNGSYVTAPPPVDDEDDDPLWRFALQVYRRPGVEAACLGLQDAAGCDVGALLYALYAAAQGRRMAEADWRQLLEGSAAWRRDIVEPLRHVRQRLRQADARGMPAASTLRQAVKRQELVAERAQLQLMQQLWPVAEAAAVVPAPLAMELADANLATYLRAATIAQADPAALDTLRQALGGALG